MAATPTSTQDGPVHVAVAIIGAGIAGLALAAGLENIPRISYDIYECVPQHGDVGAGLALHQNALRAMALIGPRIQQTYFDRALSMVEEENEEMVTEVRMAYGLHKGELVAELGRAKGRRTIARAELLKGLMELVDQERVHFSKKLQTVRQVDDKVQMTFEDGTVAHADCVIGADGVRSVVRSYILGPAHPATRPKNHDGWHIYRRMMPMSAAREEGIDPKWTKYVSIFMGPNGHINSLPLDKGKRLNVGVAVRGTKFTESGVAPELNVGDFNGYTDEARTMVSMIAKDVNMSWTAADHDHAPTYTQARVCIIGDAAHTAYGFSGQGAAQALEDCAVLIHLFKQVRVSDDVQAVLKAYDGTRRERSQAVVDLTRKYGRVYAYAEPELPTT